MSDHIEIYSTINLGYLLAPPPLSGFFPSEKGGPVHVYGFSKVQQSEKALALPQPPLTCALECADPTHRYINTRSCSSLKIEEKTAAAAAALSKLCSLQCGNVTSMKTFFRPLCSEI